MSGCGCHPPGGVSTVPHRDRERCDVGIFGERLPLDEAALIAVLGGDPSPERRIRAGESLLMVPAVGLDARTALDRAVDSDEEPVVRAGIWNLCHDRESGPRRRAEATDEIVAHARSRVPADLRALRLLNRLTLDDLLPELTADSLERRRMAAHLLAWELTTPTLGDLLIDTVRHLLADPDPLLRSHGIVTVGRSQLTALLPEVEAMLADEADAWVRSWGQWCLSRFAPPDPADDPWAGPWATPGS
ncbi:HEAT repeat domain-containing protein [Actinoplanes sp. DH11]|uniref:HEAT repeat domain-containing protein n=1 Tax=Actinoplanes sp. DH11 TaxID=2857011 RepID=UPI0035AFFCF7